MMMMMLELESRLQFYECQSNAMLHWANS